ncbi:hypothetical protein C3942_06860 [Solimonas fluminis]|uniref:DUF3108 domain-containing protein n=1 Tax=Solimonas fluminis TaxID=2086571 RepID=A0A2S5THN7_9GAMM|nr:hypothetical protein [Solimonas fluminis]PPE74481.1 hypothetical protein C3942_06860 [Solimonas fluminis]
MKMTLAVLLMLLGTAAQAEVQRFYGHAYDLKSGAYLYTEVHAQNIEGERWLGGTIDYFGPRGEKLGHKTLDFRNDEFVPVFRLDMAYGYMEAITENRQAVTMERRERAGGRTESETIGKASPMCADSGFHSCLRTHFAELQAGKTVKFTLAVAGSLDSFRFRAAKAGETQWQGIRAVLIKVEPDSLLRLLAGPLELVYEPGQRRLLEFRGISNIHNPRSGKPYDVRIIYPDKAPADAPSPLPPLGG